MNPIINLPGEEWKPIDGFDGKYLVSSCGRVQSLKHWQPRILHTFVNNKGYERVALCHQGKARYYLVSRLVAAAFCENADPEQQTTVDHIDGDTLNNHADNLRWLSMADNMKYYFEGRENK